MRAFWAAVSAVKGGSGGRLMQHLEVWASNGHTRRGGSSKLVAMHPREPVLGARARPVLGGDPAGIAHRVERRADRRIIDLALIGLGAREPRQSARARSTAGAARCA